MRTAVLVLGTILFGIVISALLSGAGARPWLRALNVPLSAVVTLGLYFCALRVYARLAGLRWAFDAVFPDRASKLVGSYLYLLLAVLVGLLLGAAERRSIKRHVKTLYRSRYSGVFAAGFLTLTAVFAAAGAGLMYAAEQEGLHISEVCPHNFNLVMDEAGNFSDYIELSNEGDTAITLSGFYLSDDGDDPTKFPLPNVELAPGAYLIVWADGAADAQTDTGEIHANFRLSDGETLLLTKDGGRTVVDAVELGSPKDNVSLTRLGSGYVLAYGTPGRSNENCQLYQAATLSAPVFSLESGFYPEESITLEITGRNGAAIYYTTDGSIPDASSRRYEGPLVLTDVSSEPNRYVNIPNTIPDYDTHEVNNDPVDKANVIRAIVIDKDGNFSPVVTATYFVGEVARAYEGYAILSVVSDPEGLFGENGICVTGTAYDEWYNNTDRTGTEPTANFYQHGRQWERTATIQLWDQEGNLLLDQDCGMRVQGNTWRKYAIKRFSFYAREYYSGSDSFDAVIFPSGQETQSFYLRSDVADVIAQDLIKNRELAIQEAIPTVCFLDGEFYTITYIRERHDSTYFAEHYGIAEEDLVVITGGELDEGTQEDLLEYQQFIRFLTEADMTDPQIYARVEAEMDVQSFLDFMVANMYSNNIDIYPEKNFKMWKSRSEGGEDYYDGKWRMASYDMDAVSWAYFVRTDSSVADLDPFKWTLGDKEKYGADSVQYICLPFFQNLLKSETFRNQFIITYLDMMNTNFSMDSYGGAVIAAYGDTQNWVWMPLLTERHSYAIEHLKFAFELDGEACEVSLSIGAGGQVWINTAEAYCEDGTWSGTYISGLEITLTAAAEPGWEFAGWEGSVSSDSETITLVLTEQGVDLTAVFVQTGGEA